MEQSVKPNGPNFFFKNDLNFMKSVRFTKTIGWDMVVVEWAR